MGGRLYDPGLRRVLTPDPMVNDPPSENNRNPYSYAMNSPLDFMDLNGLDSNWINLYYEDASAWSDADQLTDQLGAPSRVPTTPRGWASQAEFAGGYASVLSLNYVEITAALASASLARLIFARTSRPEARQTYFFGFRLRSTR